MTSSERMIAALRRNPEGLLLLGAGVALLLRNADTGTAKRPKKRGPGAEDASAAQGRGGKFDDAVEEMRTYVSDTAHDLGETASEYGRAAAAKTKQAAFDTRRKVEDVIDTHPAALAVAGLAVGCLAAAIFPSTRIEQDTLGPLGRQAADAASEAGGRLKDAAARARDQIKEGVTDGTIIEKGLSGFARDVADEFKGNVMGDGAPAAGRKAPQ